jgi:hypothetical protein
MVEDRLDRTTNFNSCKSIFLITLEENDLMKYVEEVVQNQLMMQKNFNGGRMMQKPERSSSILLMLIQNHLRGSQGMKA